MDANSTVPNSRGEGGKGKGGKGEGESIVTQTLGYPTYQGVAQLRARKLVFSSF